MLEYMEADRVGDCAIDVSYFIGIISWIEGDLSSSALVIIWTYGF